MSKEFSPMLATDATKIIDKIRYPKLASFKLDGIRCIFHPELGMVSRSLKPIRNKQLQDKFIFNICSCERYNEILDEEIYSHNLTFQEINRIVMTEDFKDPKTIKKLTKEFGTEEKARETIKKYIDSIKFYCFDMIKDYTVPQDFQEGFISRFVNDNHMITDNSEFVKVSQTVVHDAEEVRGLFKIALDNGFEGLILRSMDSPYKFGRSTLKEEYMLKVKPFESFDAEIIEVIQATKVDPDAEKTTNELGRSVTSKKKGDRILIEKASAFRVLYKHPDFKCDCGTPNREGEIPCTCDPMEYPVKVSIAMTDPEKEEVWKNRESYVGRMIEYKGMQIGAKDVPRHPVFIRFRDDRNV